MVNINKIVDNKMESGFHKKLTNFLNFKEGIVKNNIIADKLKDMVCILIGCTRDDLENEEFKNTELSQEWDKWKIYYMDYAGDSYTHYFAFENEANDLFNSVSDQSYSATIDKIKLTPRLILQLLGTDCGRDIIHPNIWVNSTMMAYDKSYSLVPKEGFVRYGDGYATEEDYKLGELIKYIMITEENSDKQYENWIVTDCRFPNEAESINQKNGIVIRVNSDRCNNEDKHPSETALDDYDKFNYVIENNGTLEELLYKVRDILKKEELL